jgi:hypothetical protein
VPFRRMGRPRRKKTQVGGEAQRLNSISQKEAPRFMGGFFAIHLGEDGDGQEAHSHFEAVNPLLPTNNEHF